MDYFQQKQVLGTRLFIQYFSIHLSRFLLEKGSRFLGPCEKICCRLLPQFTNLVDCNISAQALRKNEQFSRVFYRSSKLQDRVLCEPITRQDKMLTLCHNNNQCGITKIVSEIFFLCAARLWANKESSFFRSDKTSQNLSNLQQVLYEIRKSSNSQSTHAKSTHFMSLNGYHSYHIM